MKISEMLQNKATISFEIFPPKNKEGDISTIYHTIEELAKLSPDFISVTYGAGGSTKGKTVEIASTIKNKYNIEALAHLTCISSSKEETLEVCRSLKLNNVENILAMRGDLPSDVDFDVQSMPFKYAKDLNQSILENFGDDFCLAGACYPETHSEAECFEDDLKALKAKVDSGATFLITQIFFDNSYYYRLVQEARKIGITVPIIAGIMPIMNAKSLIKTAKLCSCTIPYALSTKLQSYYKNPAAMEEVGLNFATEQIIDLVANGVEGIHIYTMNKPEIAKSIFDRIPNVLKAINNG